MSVAVCLPNEQNPALMVDPGFPASTGHRTVSHLSTPSQNTTAGRPLSSTSGCMIHSDRAPSTPVPQTGRSTSRSAHTGSISPLPNPSMRAHPFPSTQRADASHSRVRSESVASPVRLNERKTIASRHLRERALSVADASCYHSSQRRHRSPLSSLITSPSLAPAILHPSQDADKMMGSFTPTSPPCLTLHSILTSQKTSPKLSPASLRSDRQLRVSDATVTVLNTSTLVDWSPPTTPLPSICRTPSSYTGSEYFPTAPSSAGPPTPAREPSPSPLLKPKVLHPVLESLEDASRFNRRTSCMTCKKTGTNFPCCPRCDEMWCSRECRLNGGKRHVCKARIV